MAGLALLLAGCDSGKAALETQVETLRSQNQALTTQVKTLTKERDDLKLDVDDLRKEVADVRLELRTLKEQQSSAAPETAPPATEPETIPPTQAGASGYRYEVYASCPVDVTYVTDQGIRQESEVESPWVQEAGDVSLPQVSAQLKCEGGDVTAEIYDGNTLYRTVSSKGNYAIAAAH